MLKKLSKSIKKFIGNKILRRTYERTGKCLACGKCCTHIYVRHTKDVISSEEEFERLKNLHPFYSYLEVIGKDETGLIFKCTKQDEETKLCTIHANRPLICRKYPQEELFMTGGSLAEGCGFEFTPYNTFEEIMEKVTKKQKNDTK